MRKAGTLLRAGAIYWLTIYPQVQQELQRWERQACTIPDPVLRAQALYKLSAERLNPEAAAFFAVLAPWLGRRHVVRLIVAFQLLYDYLDAVNELPACTQLESGLLLHRSLLDAVQPTPSASNYYQYSAKHDEDGGYIHALVDTCKRLVPKLTSTPRLEPLLLSAVNRVCEAQSHNHAIPAEGESGLMRWCSSHSFDRKYLWWEVAAGGISCLGVHALFALSADPRSTINDAELVDGVYFPPICALSALLDSLSDHYNDIGTANHSFTARYRDSAHAAKRFVAIANEASELIVALRNHRRHAIILAGIVAFYLSSASVRSGFPAPIVDQLTRELGLVVRPIRAIMRLRRKLHSRLGSPASE
jgi:tetraprenyl-beta-curcumene synthase